MPLGETPEQMPEPLPVAPSEYGGAARGQLPPAWGGMPDLEQTDDDTNSFNDDEADPSRPVVWFGGDFLYGWMKRAPSSKPLVTFSTPTGEIREFGLGGLDGNALSGGRFSMGAAPDWFYPVEFNIFGMRQRITNFASASDPTGRPLLVRPVVATNLIPRDVVFVSSFPDLAAGAIEINSSSLLWGVEVQTLINLGFEEGSSFDFLLGYRYMELAEYLNIFSTASSLEPILFPITFNGLRQGPGASTEVSDLFKTTNHFSGAQLAARYLRYGESFYMVLDTKLGIGATQQYVNINGSSSLNGAIPANPNGGILALPSNIGVFGRERFSIVPEATLTLGWNLSNMVRVYAGYHVLYWSHVVRPGDQIDRNIDTRQVPTDVLFNGARVRQPTVLFRETDFWIHGINLGLSFSF